MHEYVFKVQCCGAFGGYFFIAWYKYRCFRAVVVRYCEYRIIPRRYRQLNDEVKCDRFKWHRLWSWIDRLQWCFCGTIIDFHPLAVGASFDVVNDVLFQFWPPVRAFNDLYCFADPRVTMDRKIVFCLDNGAFFFRTSSDDSLTLMVPDIIDLFELMGIYPCLDLFFVL